MLNRLLANCKKYYKSATIGPITILIGFGMSRMPILGIKTHNIFDFLFVPACIISVIFTDRSYNILVLILATSIGCLFSALSIIIFRTLIKSKVVAILVGLFFYYLLTIISTIIGVSISGL